MWKKVIFTGILSLFITVIAWGPMAAVQAAEFSSPSETVVVDGSHRKLNVKNGREKLKFVYQDKTCVLKLMSRDGKQDYLSFLNYYGGRPPGAAWYTVKEIHTTNPELTFYEINAFVGAHAKNVGYWIVGKHSGQWVTYISLDNLATMGYTVGKWHQIHTKINENGDGRFILISQHEYMPPGAIYGYQKRMAVDLRLELFWDDQAQWFGMRSL